MTSRERLLAVLEGRAPDHVPLTTWSFGVHPPPHLRWETDGREVEYWYSMRLEHLHTLPSPWGMVDEARRAAAWLALGIDDVMEISVPWGRDPEVTWIDSVIPPGVAGNATVMLRDYTTPAGPIRHAVKKTDDAGPGWVLQPGHVPLIEDFNVPRGVKHAVAGPGDVPPIRHLFMPPDADQRQEFLGRMKTLGHAADGLGVMVQAWTAFGIDAAVWFAGAEGAVMMAMEEPEAFRQLVDIIRETDVARTELAAATPGVDMVCQRGWYSSSALWSPRLFERFAYPQVADLAALAHRHGKKFAYVMTTGVKRFGPRLADAGVDLLYFVDPVQDRITLEEARDLLADRMTVAGGTNALSLASGDPRRISDEVRSAVDVLRPTNRFILHPVDALFPDTPWEGVETMIEAWKTCQ